MLKVLLFVFLFIASASADCYMHNPRGSNDRLNEQNENRNNANHLFDSQNNAKGGYCRGNFAGNPYYYEGSLLSIEWTNQHACSNPKVHCNFVIQYMCSASDAPAAENIRDGTTTDTIPTDQTQAQQETNPGVYKYAQHEPFSYYDACSTRRRNGGLYIADRAIEGNLNANPDNNPATRTRQNNNGNRHGYECPEERDYYPYWHPSPWKDIAVLVDPSDSTRCEFYKAHSQNKEDKYQCLKSDGTFAQQNNEAACGTAGNQWTKTDAWGIAAPDCIATPWNRDNHLGNGVGAYFNRYNWTIPKNEDCIKDDNCNCVLRIRYNISSEVQWDWDSSYNGEASPVKNDDTITVQGEDGDQPLELAMDTTQFGRTFQDRSHVFGIKKRPKGVFPNAKIYNLNVRGKRGNIVQAYPAVEYDYTPNLLDIYVNDYVHIQFTGCDNNPNGNAGEGTAGTDRSNIVQMESLDLNYPATKEWLSNNPNLFEGDYLKNFMALAGADATKCGQVGQVANNDNDPTNCQKLNPSAEHFDGGLIQMNTTGSFYFMNTRNNNFTNRSQKGVLNVNNLLPAWGIALVVIGVFVFVGASVVAGLMFYAKSHIHSPVATFLGKF